MCLFFVICVKFVHHLSITFHILLPVANSQPLGAKINSNGVKGVVYLYPGTHHQASLIAVTLSGLKFPNTIDIRESRTLHNVEKKCLDEDLGPR